MSIEKLNHQRRKRLTVKEREAVCLVLEEFLAGHDAEMVKGIGLVDSEAEGALVLARLNSAAGKLSP